MRALLRREVAVAAPARTVWAYVTDWDRQGDWIPLTEVHAVAAAHEVGGSVRAWTGIGPIGFWDPMTITAWQEQPDGSARCEVLHTGSVLRGEGEFAVVAETPQSCTFVWSERLAVPGGPLGAAVWKATAALAGLAVDFSLRRLAARAEALHAAV